jgi:hypothetical protein
VGSQEGLARVDTRITISGGDSMSLKTLGWLLFWSVSVFVALLIVKSNAIERTQPSRLVLSRSARLSLEEQKIRFVRPPSRAHSQQGHKTETKLLLPNRGGQLTISRLIWPTVTDSRYSEMAVQ